MANCWTPNLYACQGRWAALMRLGSLTLHFPINEPKHCWLPASVAAAHPWPIARSRWFHGLLRHVSRSQAEVGDVIFSPAWWMAPMPVLAFLPPPLAAPSVRLLLIPLSSSSSSCASLVPPLPFPSAFLTQFPSSLLGGAAALIPPHLFTQRKLHYICCMVPAGT